MPVFLKCLLILHIAGGTAGLISGTIASSVTKGNRTHKLSGKIFFWAMLLASVAALVLSNLPGHKNVFLFAVGGFTFYMICSGYRIVHLKRSAKQNIKLFAVVDYAIFLYGLFFGIYLAYMGVESIIQGENFGIVPCVFGLVCLNFAKDDYVMIFKKAPLKQIWIRSHIIRMMGAMIASYTAFLVVNIQMQPNWILWLAPSFAGTILIISFLRKYAPKLKKAPVSN